MTRGHRSPFIAKHFTNPNPRIVIHSHWTFQNGPRPIYKHLTKLVGSPNLSLARPDKHHLQTNKTRVWTNPDSWIYVDRMAHSHLDPSPFQTKHMEMRKPISITFYIFDPTRLSLSWVGSKTFIVFKR